MMSSWTRVAVWSISTTAPRRMRLWFVQPSALAESRRSKGRIRLPPPAMRYWAMSVMTSTFEADWRENSCSMAARSSRRRSNTSAAVAMESVLTYTVRVSGCGFGFRIGSKKWGSMLMIAMGKRVGRVQGLAAVSTVRERGLVGTEVGELELDADVFAAEKSHDLLQHVAVF